MDALELGLHEALVRGDPANAGRMLVEHAEKLSRSPSPLTLARRGDLTGAFEAVARAPPSRVLPWHLLLAWDARVRGDDAGAHTLLERASSLPLAIWDATYDVWGGLLLPVALPDQAFTDRLLRTPQTLRGHALRALVALRRFDDAARMVGDAPVVVHAATEHAGTPRVIRALVDAGHAERAVLVLDSSPEAPVGAWRLTSSRWGTRPRRVGTWSSR